MSNSHSCVLVNFIILFLNLMFLSKVKSLLFFPYTSLLSPCSVYRHFSHMRLNVLPTKHLKTPIEQLVKLKKMHDKVGERDLSIFLNEEEDDDIISYEDMIEDDHDEGFILIS